MTWDPAARLLTVDEAAESVDRPASTIRRWMSEGRLTPHAHHGRRNLILEADLLRVEASLSVPRGRMKPRDAGTSGAMTD